MKAASAIVPFDAGLRAALLAGTQDAGLETDGKTVVALPLDILQKLALRCASLLKQPDSADNRP